MSVESETDIRVEAILQEAQDYVDIAKKLALAESRNAGQALCWAAEGDVALDVLRRYAFCVAHDYAYGTTNGDVVEPPDAACTAIDVEHLARIIEWARLSS
jgi:hypothetical protein